jgi:hypothetical protein
MPNIKPSRRTVRVSFSIRRPKTAKGHANLQAAVEKFVKKYGGKLKKKPKKKGR